MLNFLKMDLKSLTINSLLLVSILSSCKKVELEEQVLDKYPTVVEARMTNLDAVQVNLSQVMPLSHPDSVISGAFIEITPEGGSPVQLLEAAPGHYQHDLKTLSGQRYTLRIEAGGKVLLATSTAPTAAISIDSVTAESKDDTLIVLTCHLRLPPTRPVYARLLVLIDDVVQEDFLIEESIEPSAVFQQRTEPFIAAPGSRAMIQLTSFSKTDYEFYRSMRLLTLGNNFNPSNIRNPPSNFSGDAIGLFSAALADSTSLIIW